LNPNDPTSTLPSETLRQRLMRVWPYFRGARTGIVFAALATVVGALTEPLIPALLKTLLDRGFNDGRVALSMVPSGGTCDRCTAGLTMKCRPLYKYGHGSVLDAPFAHGMIATRVRLLPGTPVLRIPDSIDDETMVSAGCAVATAGAVVTAADPGEGERVLVLGAGAVGFYCAAMLASLGCDVVVQDPSESRRDLVESIGIRTRAGAEGDAWEPSIVVEASGNARAAADAFGLVAIGGHVVAAGSVSPGSTSITLDPALLVTRRVRYSGIHNYTPAEFRWSVDWLRAFGADLPTARLLSPPFPLNAIGKAFEAMATGEFPRVAVRPDPA